MRQSHDISDLRVTCQILKKCLTVAGYNDYRVFCGLKRAHTFEDLAGEMKDVRARRMLQKIYRLA